MQVIESLRHESQPVSEVDNLAEIGIGKRGRVFHWSIEFRSDELPKELWPQHRNCSHDEPGALGYVTNDVERPN